LGWFIGIKEQVGWRKKGDDAPTSLSCKGKKDIKTGGKGGFSKKQLKISKSLEGGPAKKKMKKRNCCHAQAKVPNYKINGQEKGRLNAGGGGMETELSPTRKESPNTPQRGEKNKIKKGWWEKKTRSPIREGKKKKVG